MRMQMRRFTRLTNAFSKKLENHIHMVALYAVWYNFVKMHKKHKMTPAMAAGVSNRLWSMEDVAALVDAAAPTPGKRGRSEEHTSELQSLMRISYAVFCLKKKTKPDTTQSLSTQQ